MPWISKRTFCCRPKPAVFITKEDARAKARTLLATVQRVPKGRVVAKEAFLSSEARPPCRRAWGWALQPSSRGSAVCAPPGSKIFRVNPRMPIPSGF
jgi:hypothetical protein